MLTIHFKVERFSKVLNWFTSKCISMVQKKKLNHLSDFFGMISDEEGEKMLTDLERIKLMHFHKEF